MKINVLFAWTVLANNRLLFYFFGQVYNSISNLPSCSLSNIRAPPEHDQEADGQRGQHEAGAAEQGYQVRDHAGGPHDGEKVSILIYFPN